MWRWYAPGSSAPIDGAPVPPIMHDQKRRPSKRPAMRDGAEMIETLKQRVNGDEGLVRRGRYLTTSFLLEVGADRLADLDLRGPHRVGDAGAVRDAVIVLCAARARRGMAEILEQPAAAGLQRSDGADQAARAEGRRRSADIHGQSALLQGSACQAARREPPHEREIRADHRPLHASRSVRPAAPHLCRGGGRGHAAAVPAHRRQRRPAIPRA